MQSVELWDNGKAVLNCGYRGKPPNDRIYCMRLKCDPGKSDHLETCNVGLNLNMC